MNFNKIYFLSLIIPFFHLFFFQIKNLEIKNPMNCLKLFKSNNTLGLIILINIATGKIL